MTVALSAFPCIVKKMSRANTLADLRSTIPRRALEPVEITAACAALIDPATPDAAKVDFLRTWSARGETAAELAVCAESFLPQARHPGVSETWFDHPLLDCSGTGGGGLNLVNISTGIMFILAAMDVPVVKHGNRGLTKKSGSADVLEALGIRIDLPPELNAACLAEVGCVFLFAPHYHPSFAAVAAARRQLGAEGTRTVFNLLGPLLNPARPAARLVGVFKDEHVKLYDETLRAMHCPHFAVVCGEDRATGKKLGEVSADGRTLIRAAISTSEEYLSRRRPETDRDEKLESLLVTDAADSARRLVALLDRQEQGLARATLLANAGLAAWVQGAAASWDEGLALSQQALDSGRARERLERWRKFSQR